MHPMFRHPLRFPRDHRFALAHASEYLDGDLDDSARARIEQHLRFCPKCYELLVSLRRTITALGDLRRARDEAADEDITSLVIERLRAER